LEHWEDIFKDKLENLERPLPDGDLSEFRDKLVASRLEGKRNAAGVCKVFAFAFVAAVLALFLLLPNRVSDDKLEENLEIVSAVENDNSEPAVRIEVARPVKSPDISSRLASNAPETVIVTDSYEEEDTRETVVDLETEENGSVEESRNVEESKSPFRTSSPVNFNVQESFRPINAEKKRKITIVSAAVGGFTASALISLLAGSGNRRPVYFSSYSSGQSSGIVSEIQDKFNPGKEYYTDGVNMPEGDVQIKDNGEHNRDAVFDSEAGIGSDVGTGHNVEIGDDVGTVHNNETGSSTDVGTGSGDLPPKTDPSSPQPKQEPSRYYSHTMPLTVSLSVRYPISDKLSLNSGVDYSIYKSTVYCGESVWGQSVHYLGVPLRLDYSFVDTRFLNIYVGAGPELDWCLKAVCDGKTTGRDGLGISLDAAAGIQFNINACLGLFVEPRLGWFFRTDRQVLNTWRTEHPVSFNVSFGLRYTIK